jgi:4-amino-4-deoxy-L-arabinose transferase-like glycosyltransferase
VFDPPATIDQMPPLRRLHDFWPGGTLADAAYWIFAVAAGTAMYFGPLILGLGLWLRHRPMRTLEPGAGLAISLLVVGAAIFYFYKHDFLGQCYFTQYGLFAVMPYAAAGFSEFAAERSRAGGVNWWKLLAFSVAWVAAAYYLAIVGDHQLFGRHYARDDLISFGPALLCIGVLAAACLIPRARQTAASLAVLAVLLTAALDVPIDDIPWKIRYLSADLPLYQTSPAGLRPGTLAGTEWIRDHIPSDAVLAVSNDRTRHTRRLAATDATYPAFTEHQTFREGWYYTSRSDELGAARVAVGQRDPFPERTALENAVFRRGDSAALRTMVNHYGVSYIVVSKKDGPVNPRVYRLGRLIYSNGAVDVIDARDVR